MKRMIPAAAMLLLLVASPVAGLAGDLESVKKEPNLERRSERALDNADAAYKEARSASESADVEKLKAALAEIAASVDLCVESLKATGKKARRSPKYFKKAELRMRDLARRLDSLAKDSSLDERPLVEAAHKHVMEAQETLLHAIMGQ